jgi:hypothetical protein
VDLTFRPSVQLAGDSRRPIKQTEMNFEGEE